MVLANVFDVYHVKICHHDLLSRDLVDSKSWMWPFHTLFVGQPFKNVKGRALYGLRSVYDIGGGQLRRCFRGDSRIRLKSVC